MDQQQIEGVCGHNMHAVSPGEALRRDLIAGTAWGGMRDRSRTAFRHDQSAAADTGRHREQVGAFQAYHRIQRA